VAAQGAGADFENCEVVGAGVHVAQGIGSGDGVTVGSGVINGQGVTAGQGEGMGTTVVACLLYDNRLVSAHVGDSRLYRMHQGKLSQVTLDHSLLQELVDRGFYTPAEAAKVANKNYVTRALGVEPLVDVEVREYPVSRGDCLLLCSDGLTDMVEDKQIELALTTFGSSLETAARQLVQMANDNGGRDNVSVVLAEVAAPFPVKKGILDRILGWFG
ncbi:MAG: SpoIIE family protein phosphatase, partial [Steroidobacteraceae bacterium]